MEQTQYLRLKVLNLEHQNMLLRLEQTKQTVKTAYDNELRKFGLDPAINYQMDDQTFSVTPIVAQNTSVLDAEVVKEN